MKTMMTLAALLLGTTAALAGPFGLPDHQQDGYRDTGCEETAFVDFTNDDGEQLYRNNATCPGVGGGSNADALAGMRSLYPTPEVEDEEEVATK